MGRFIDRETGHNRSDRQKDNGRISNSLRIVVLSLGGQGFAQTKIVKSYLKRSFERSGNGQQRSPLSGKNCVGNIEQAVYGEKPHKQKMHAYSLGKARRYTKKVVKSLREKMEKLVPEDLYRINIICPVD